ncbi:sn-glycerol-3-phosphate ABC transporter ATP-binding protein UgpC [Aminobacter sp. MSH1]|uniref:ABC transporter ATP-binding protein n=1 Tax=Aminobacter sp. MSH1 TaxID=374606 RepID=UPI000D37792B|nr:sn-glycerol-3-phosphate ABC transporter ATP-binding protein UgpC [Aminobacter sp. MSH1]
MASVTLDRVEKSYGHLAILKDISIHIDDGTFLVLVGPSGCGKSTLLRMIAGLESISAGTIGIGGRVVNDLPPKSRDIAMVFQNYALYPHMTVAENMGFALKLARTPQQEVDTKVRRASSILGLDALLNRYPKQLSGGQRQRVAMGRAIVRDPAVFLFDEPLSNLDAKLRVQMRTEIKALHQRLKTTTIYVTHDQIEAMTMADRIVVMKDGDIEQAGSPLEVYDRPRSMFVAGFIGSPAMNFFEGRITADSFVTETGATLPLPVGTDLVGRHAVYGIRPEDLSCFGDGVAATVEVIEPTGSETLVSARFAGQLWLLVLRDRIDLSPGATIALSPRLDRVHLFDKQTGLRLN